MNIENAISKINKIDHIYKTSPTVQCLASNAPLILTLFREMRQDFAMRRMEIERICAQRETDLQKFKEIAPTMTKELSFIGQHIRDLQKTVRETAATLDTNPNAQIVIDYTNKQISDAINLFNNLAYHLLMS